MSSATFEPIGAVRSAIQTRADAPHQGATAGTKATIEIDERFAEGISDLKAGMDIWVLFHFDKADEALMKVHPRGNPEAPLRSLFATRAPCRPSPIGLTLVRILTIEANSIAVRGLEAIDGTPILDIKPYSKALDSPRPE